jgi:carbon storage regulator
MLVLSRKTGESIRIGSDITVTVLEIQGNRMKVGISAPATSRVLRGELADTIKGSPSAREPRPEGRAKVTTWLELPTSTIPSSEGVLAASG